MVAIPDTIGSIYGTITIAILVLVVLKCIQMGRTYRSWCRAAAKVIGPPVHPLWGTLNLRVWNEVGRRLVHQAPLNNLLQQEFPTPDLYKAHMIKMIQETRTKLVRFWMGPFYPCFSASHPDSAKIILKSSEPKCRYVGGPYRMLESWLGDGLLISGGSKWQRNRQMLTSAFHFEILKPYMPVYNQVSDTFLDKLAKEAKGGKSFEICNTVCLATLDTMLQCAFSYQGDVQGLGDNHPYVNSVKELATLILRRCTRPYYFFDIIYRLFPAGRRYFQLCDYVHQFSSDIIAARKKTLLNDPEILKSKKRLDFLDILLSARDENGKGLSDQDVRDEADTFLFEGHDTTASSIGWAIYSLGKYPDIQAKVYEDVHAAMNEKDYFDWKDIQKCQYLTLFLKEVMRMYSPVPFIMRQLTKSCVVDGVEIPESLAVEIPIYLIHHHPDVWPDHMEFKPERFLNDQSKDNDPYSFIPFSAGPRFIVTVDPEHKIDEIPELVMRAKYGIKVRMELRKQ